MERSKHDVPRAQEGVSDVDAFVPPTKGGLFRIFENSEIAALRIRNLISASACEDIAARLLASEEIVRHADVEGLRVLGLSHFQVARNVALRSKYAEEARTSAGTLRFLSAPHASPFDSALAFLAQSWSGGCQIMTLPTEGNLSPFTIRIYGNGVGIDPHQDILSAESPNDAKARVFTTQLAANIYLSMGEGGALEIFDEAHSATGYTDLSEGPKVVERDRLPPPEVTLEPEVGDLVVFPSRRVHAVAPNRGEIPRITVSFFIGVMSEQEPLQLWA
jgi:hypothetical protein